MELFWKVSASILISVVLILTLGKQERDIAVLLTIGVCCMVGLCATQMLKQVTDFIYSLQVLTHADDSIFKTLFKIMGVSFLGEIISSICTDAGCSSLGKSLQLLGSVVIISLSIPLIKSFLSLLQNILGAL